MFTRRVMISGAALAFATAVVGLPAAVAGTAVYTNQGSLVYKGATKVATALSPGIAAALVGNLNGTSSPSSAYAVSGSRGILRTSQSRVVATATTTSAAAALVQVLNAGHPAGGSGAPGRPTLAAPVASGPGSVDLHWTAPASGASAITRYDIRIDGILQ